jgi:hypothetical protein
MLKTLYQLFVRFSTGLRLFRVDVGVLNPDSMMIDDKVKVRKFLCSYKM